MPFPQPPVTTLVLPTGATSGARIVLDGTSDTITGYNPDNSQAWQLSGGAPITATNATNATNAVNLTGGGSASGSTTIAGALVVGNPAAAHVIVGADSNGADGVRLYAGDGVTPLIDLNIAAGPVFSLQTAASGLRVVIDTTDQDRVQMFTGDSHELNPGRDPLTAASTPRGAQRYESDTVERHQPNGHLSQPNSRVRGLIDPARSYPPTVITVPFEIAASAKIGASGTASVTFAPVRAGEWWDVQLVTADSKSMTVTVTRNSTVVDSTTADPRPQVTSDSKYPLQPGEVLTVSWAGGTNGTTVTASVIGDKHLPS